MKKLALILILSMILRPFEIKSQEVGSWWMYFSAIKFHEKWSFWNEAQYRSHDHGENIEQLLLRVAPMYHLSQSSTIAFGYAYIADYSFETDINEPNAEEGRIFEQYILKHKIPRLGFEHRFRLEQRWKNGHYLNRFRYRLFLTIPIGKKEMEPDTWFAAVYDEVFLHTVPMGEKDTYLDRNRLYIAGGYQFNQATNVQMGMMNQLTPYRDKWYFQLALNWNPNFL